MTKVLIAVTGATEWSLKDGSKHFGGVWSPEFVFPHDSFTKAGYEVVVATLGGVPAIVDPASLTLGLQENDPASVDFQRSYLRRPEIVAALARPARLEEPGPPPANDPMPVHLTELDRGRAAATFDQMAQSIAGYEASAEVTPFTSKFDAVLAGKAQFAPQEQAGYALFRGKAQCNNCHRDGGPGEDPLFTDFTASNIGTPANPLLPYYAEQQPDAQGYAANPAGSGYVDPGVGGFLTERNLLSHPSAVDAPAH